MNPHADDPGLRPSAWVTASGRDAYANHPTARITCTARSVGVAAAASTEKSSTFSKGVQADHVPRLLRILSTLDVAQGPDDLAIPSFRTHRLKGDLAGHCSIWVNGSWRITFRFVDSDV